MKQRPVGQPAPVAQKYFAARPKPVGHHSAEVILPTRDGSHHLCTENDIPEAKGVVMYFLRGIFSSLTSFGKL